ncbi:MAG: phosphate acyltransferase PlsX [Deltaproteobacteria bacterium]|nr:phosphate acyltransferase PlsX [Deltaproteobacteria bacterium]
MTILALDAMGGDHAPDAVVAGAASLTLETSGPRVVLVGDGARIEAVLRELPHDRARLEVVDAPEHVAMDAEPRAALEAHPRASVIVAAELVRDGRADALVSAGNTGAFTLACARTFARIPGVSRCALGAVYPTERRRGEKEDPFSLILDAGLTLDPTADDLVGFAVMGAAYSARISRNPEPTVALLSNGSEPTKGPAAIVRAHERLLATAGLHFIGNVEGTDIPKGTADVVVTGGFTGNVVLKMLEGIAETVMNLGRYAYRKSLRNKAGLALLAPAVKQLKEVTDWEEYGGAPILGFDRVCIKAHGRSSPRAVRNALKVAQKAVRSGLCEAIRLGLQGGQGSLPPD